MNDIEARAAYVHRALTLDVVASLEGGRGIILGAEGAACVAGGGEVYVKGGEVGV